VPLVWAVFLEATRSWTASASRGGFHHALAFLQGLFSLCCSALHRFAIIVLLHCLLAGLRFVETGQVMTIESHTTEDASTHPLAERLQPEPFRTQKEVAVLGALAGRMRTSEVSQQGGA
jgi:hypothetical protein